MLLLLSHNTHRPWPRRQLSRSRQGVSSTRGKTFLARPRLETQRQHKIPSRTKQLFRASWACLLPPPRQPRCLCAQSSFTRRRWHALASCPPTGSSPWEGGKINRHGQGGGDWRSPSESPCSCCWNVSTCDVLLPLPSPSRARPAAVAARPPPLPPPAPAASPAPSCVTATSAAMQKSSSVASSSLRASGLRH